MSLDEAQARGSLLEVLSYHLFVDLTAGADTFSSRTELRFRCRDEGAGAFADLEAIGLRGAVLNGAELTGRRPYRDGRLELPRLLAGENTSIVDAEFADRGGGVNLSIRLCEQTSIAATSSLAGSISTSSGQHPGTEHRSQHTARRPGDRNGAP